MAGRFGGGSGLPRGPRWCARVGIPLLGPLLLAACGNAGPATLTVVSYNVQNLYDATDDGGEYREFTAAGGWNEALYTAKLRAIGSALRSAVAAGADLVALQEVEHAGAARRLVNLELSRQGYRHVVWLPDARSTTGPVVLSKLPVRRVGALWVEGSPEQPLRPILEVEVALGQAADARSLFLFNNHWKSRHGGAAETERWRRRAAAVLVSRLRELHAVDPAADVIVAGDLNVSVDEYERRQRRYVTALMPPAAAADTGGAARHRRCPRRPTQRWLCSARGSPIATPAGLPRGATAIGVPGRPSTTCCWARGCSTAPA